MTMQQKLQAKKSKKGFTLVELVIVIAILAILAAIAIPVITTTINSAKLSTLESDATTIDMCLKEALNTYKTDNNVTKYNGVTAASCTVASVFSEQGLDSGLLSVRQIGGASYQIQWKYNANSTGGEAVISGTGYVTSGTSAMTATTSINALGKK